MKKQSTVFRLAALAMALICLCTSAGAEQLTEPTQYVPGGPSAASDLAFGSVCVLNGCRTIDSFVPLAGNGRLLDSAQAAIAYERNTGTLIYAYNPDAQLPPGNLTKLVTALLAIEYCDPEDSVIVSSRNISKLPAGSINVNLKEGEVVTVNDLLHCMILQAANDAAIALAEHIAGNMEAFVTLMNARVKQMGCSNTVFVNVHGLDNSMQHTTARDVAKIMLEATKNERFRNLLSEQSYTVPETNRSEARKFQCQNYLMDAQIVQKFYDQRVTGGLQGASPTIGASIACTAKSGNMDVIFVVLGCTRQLYENGWQVKVYGNFEEAQSLINYVFNTYKSNRILYNGQALKQFSVSGGENQMVACPHLDLDSVLPADAHMDNLIMYYKDTGLTAPIQKDEMVSTVEVWYRSTCLLEAELYAMEDVRLASQSGLEVLGGADRSNSESTLSRYALIFCLAILVPVGGYLGLRKFLRYRRKKQRRRRKGAGGGRYQ